MNQIQFFLEYLKDMIRESFLFLSKKQFGINPHKALFGIIQGGLFEDLRLTNKQQQESLITSCCLLSDQEIEVFISDRYL